MVEVGQRVRVLVDTPDGSPVDGVVAVVNDPETSPGQVIGVELDNYAHNGHTLEGTLSHEEKIDQQTGARFGRGWWTREENIEVLSEE